MGRTSPVGPYATRRLATTHPFVYLVLGAAVALGGLVVLALLPARQLDGGARTLLAAFAVAAGLTAAAPGLWSLRHRDEAAAAVDVRSRQDVQSSQRHPVTSFVVLPVLATAVLAWRNGRSLEHLGHLDLALVLTAGVVVLAALRWAGFVVERRRVRTGDQRVSPERRV